MARPDPDYLPIRRLVPNLMTLGALVCGLTAIRVALYGETALALALILLAALLDGLDGRVARFLDGETAMGAELDSLADFLNFGVAPAFVLYWTAFSGDGRLGWIAALAYAVACVLRLARFNIDARKPPVDAPKPDTFTGVPSPAGALLVMVPLYLMQAFPGLALPDLLVALWAVMVGGLMIARWPTPSLKSVRIRREHVRAFLLGAAGLGLVLVIFPWATITLIALAYLGFVLRGWAGLWRQAAPTERND
jgi:CDP-diacylglycerol---serine O-phosphatidyltransferase